MKLKKKLLSATLAMGFAMGFAGQANAYVYGGSSIYIGNLLISLTDSSGTDIPDAATTFNFDVSSLARIVPGGTEAWSNTCGSLGSACGAVSPVLELLDGATPTAANAPGSSTDRAAQDFSIWGPASGNGEYANANAEIDTAQLTQGIPSSTNHIAEAEIDSVKTEANSNAVLGSQTDFTLEFTIGNGYTSPVTLTVAFDADPYLQAVVNEGLNEAGQCRAAHTAVVSMQGDGGTFSWSPQGTTNVNDCLAGGGLTCVETDDTQDLNETISTGPDNGSEALSVTAGFTAFGITISGLTAGDYSLSLSANTSTVLSRAAIPEPEVLLLLGMGLMGIPLSRRLRKRKTGAA